MKKKDIYIENFEDLISEMGVMPPGIFDYEIFFPKLVDFANKIETELGWDEAQRSKIFKITGDYFKTLYEKIKKDQL